MCNESFTIVDVPVNTTRGFHAHIITQQLLVLIKGSIELKVISKKGIEIIYLNSPGEYFLLEPLCWGEQKFTKENTVLQVFSSDVYNPDDYITEIDDLQKRWATP